MCRLLEWLALAFVRVVLSTSPAQLEGMEDELRVWLDELL